MGMQEHREFAVVSDLGPDVLLLAGMNAVERISDLFEFDLELLTRRRSSFFDQLLGSNMTVRAGNGANARFFNGFVASMTLTGRRNDYSLYQVTLRPWLWFLTRTRDCRIFQDRTVPQIVEEVLGVHTFTNVLSRLRGTYLPWEYCVQYQESDFDFISRLLEHEGIYYYFTHANGSHQLVLGDGITAHDPAAAASLPYRPAPDARELNRSVTDWTATRSVEGGAVTLADFDDQVPQNLRTGDYGRNDAEKRLGQTVRFDYGVGIGYVPLESRGAAAEALARSRAQEIAIRRYRLGGRTTSRGLGVGQLFSLTEHVDTTQNQQYLLVSTITDIVSDAHEATGGGVAGSVPYVCRFEVTPARIPYRPARVTPWPVMQGPQTAIVTGDRGKQVPVDDQGRIRVRFHWDRRGLDEGHTSCAIRVSQPWAGKRWGAQFLPRFGQEVIVDFLDGDPNRPIVTGRVYNAETRHPFDPAHDATISGFRSHSAKGANEFWFDDKAGSEQLYLHAQRHYDLRVRQELAEYAGGDRHSIVARNRRQQVQADDHLSVKGDRNVKIDGTLSIFTGDEWQQRVAGMAGLEIGSEFHVKAGTTLILEAGSQITLKAGGSFITIGPSGVAINGSRVQINSGGSPGSGSGASPDDPRLPRAARGPGVGEAMDKATTRSRRAEPGALDSHPVSAQMRRAHRDAAPFCAACPKPSGTGMR